MRIEGIKRKISSVAIGALVVIGAATGASGQPSGWVSTVDKSGDHTGAHKPAQQKQPARQKPAAAAEAAPATEDVADKRAAERPQFEKSAVEKPAIDKPTSGQAADERPAQEQPASTPQPATGDQGQTLQADWIKAQIDEIVARRDLEEAARGQAVELYRSALSQLEAARRFNSSAAEFQEALQTSPQKTAEFRQQLEILQRSAGGDTIAGPSHEKMPASLVETEQRLDAVRAEMAALAHEKSQLDASSSAMSSRPETARAEQANEKQGLDSMAGGMATARAGDPPVVAEARRVAASADHLARSAKLTMLQQELISLPARQALATVKRDLAGARLSLLEATVESLRAHLDDLRKRDAAKSREQSERAAEQVALRHPLLERYSDQTKSLQSERAGIEERIDADRSALAALKPETARVAESLSAADRLREIGAIGDELGDLLRHMRVGLPAESTLRNEIADRERAIVDARLKRLKLEEEKRTAGTPSASASKLLDRLKSRADAPFAGEPDLPTRLESLTRARLDAVSGLLDTLNRRVDQLVELNVAAEELLSGSVKLTTLLDERLLWLPSSPSYGLEWIDQITSSIKWLGRPNAWLRVVKALNESTARHPIRVAGMLALMVVLVLLRRRLKQRLDAIAENVGKLSLDGLQLTPLAFLLSFLLALPWAIPPGLVGWLLLTAPSARLFVTSIGTGFVGVGVAVLVLRSISTMAGRKGILVTHFSWHERTSRVVRANTLWLTFLAVPAVFLLSAIGSNPSQLYREGLGRLVFLVACSGLSFYLFRMLDHRKGVMATMAEDSGRSRSMNVLWRMLATTMPLAIGTLGFTGYYDGGMEMLVRFIASLVIVLGGIIVYGVAVRSLLITRQRLEVRRARERREKAKAARSGPEGLEATGDAVPAKLEVEDVDLAVVSEQTRALLRTFVVAGVALGIWLVWRQMASALTMFDDVQLWTQVIATKDGTKVVPVTLSNVLIGSAIAGVTLIAARNLPGLMEIVVLQRLAIDSGTRYALSAIARYSIITAGLLVALQRVGADWSQMQWIVAALGVGVGFGLQEIVANFVSGLIILFERPVRVGDVVTVGEHSGTISRIQIRATSITDWDNREIIVPNKALLTDKVINWTLTERVTRLLLKVGVAYGSDTELTQRVMLETVKANPRVLTEPNPTVFFLGFGASSLDFEVRVFVAETSHRMPVMHELHVAIERALRKNGIEIPFPQQDLHLRIGELDHALSSASIRALRSKLQGAG